MYLLYAPFLLVITIAALLAVSTSNIQTYLESLLKYKLLAALTSSLIMAVLFFAPLGYFLATLTIQLNTLEPESYLKIETYVQSWIETPPEYLAFLKPYALDAIKDMNINNFTSIILTVTGKVGAFSAGFLKNAFLVIVFYFFVCQEIISTVRHEASSKILESKSWTMK